MDMTQIEHVALHGNKSGLHGSHQQTLQDFVENCPSKFSAEAQGMINPGPGLIYDLFLQHGWPPDAANEQIDFALRPYYKRRRNRR